MSRRKLILPIFLSAILVSIASIHAPSLAADVPLSAARERALNPKDNFKECDTCPEMVVVPAGSFTMGSADNERDNRKSEVSDEIPQHQVMIATPFAVGKYEVTVDQFTSFVKESGYDPGSKCWTFEEQGKYEERSNRSFRNPGYEQNGSHPAACLNWYDAKAYVDWLSRKTGKHYRLLTEAEWEYAARGRTTPGSAPRFHYGDNDMEMCRYGNVADQTAKKTLGSAVNWAFLSCDDGYVYTAPVGSFAANAFGLYDIHGNVWEWTADCYNDSYRGAPTNASAWSTGNCNSRILRGGAWDNKAWYLRAAVRYKDDAMTRDFNYGLRVARTLVP